MGTLGGGMWGVFPIPAYGDVHLVLGIAFLEDKKQLGSGLVADRSPRL